MTGKNLNTLREAFRLTKSNDEMNALLRGLFTQKELEELPKRLTIFAMLKKRIPQHKIAEKVGVGIATVTRGSLELQRGNIQKTSWWHNLTPMGG
jgi:TrpR family trp operon transcriptional repressor